MVQNIRFEELGDIARNNKVTVALIYDKWKKLCKRQEKEFKSIEDKLKPHGVVFVKLDRAKDNVKNELGVDTVPSILMWIRKGIQVSYQFEENGKKFMQINGFIASDVLLKHIAELLNHFVR